jgi:hypothetical protein
MRLFPCFSFEEHAELKPCPQSERQSVVSYHKEYEAAKGTYTATTSDPTLERVKAAQTAISGAAYSQRDGGPTTRHPGAGAAAPAHEEPAAPPPQVAITKRMARTLCA